MKEENELNAKEVSNGVEIFYGKLCHKLLSELSKSTIIVTCKNYIIHID